MFLLDKTCFEEASSFKGLLYKCMRPIAIKPAVQMNYQAFPFTPVCHNKVLELDLVKYILKGVEFSSLVLCCSYSVNVSYVGQKTLALWCS